MTFPELDILEQLESISGKNDKKSLLESSKDNKKLEQLLNAAFNFFKKYGIKKFDMPMPIDKAIDRHDAFINMLDLLARRGVTGDAAVSTVESFFKVCTEQQQKWYYRVLHKDLRIGVSIDTAIKCGFSIPKFDVMLAKDGYKTKKAKQLIKAGGFASRKFNGYRCLAICNGDSVVLHTRNGKVYENFPQIEEELTKLLRGHPIVLDGEIMSDDFNSMQQSAFASTRGTTVGDVKFHIFGLVNYDEWMSGEFKQPTTDRLRELTKLFMNQLKDSKLLTQVEQVYVDDFEKIRELESTWHKDGYEGAMFLPGNIPYYLGKKTNRLMKFKPMATWDCEVIGCIQGEADGKYADTLGALKVLQENGVECEVGTGFTDAEREYIWSNKESIIGRLCEVQYQELSKKDKRMIFPSFQRWRDSGKGTGKI